MTVSVNKIFSGYYSPYYNTPEVFELMERNEIFPLDNDTIKEWNMDLSSGDTTTSIVTNLSEFEEEVFDDGQWVELYVLASHSQPPLWHYDACVPDFNPNDEFPSYLYVHLLDAPSDAPGTFYSSLPNTDGITLNWDPATGNSDFSNVALGSRLAPPASPKISGYIRTSGGSGILGVSVAANNGGGSYTTTSSGYYEFTVPHGWEGSITPSKSGYSFSPPAASSTGPITTDQSSVNFTGTPITPKISGYVGTTAGNRSNVVISADNGGGSSTTDSGGYYELTVPYNWSGVVTPSKSGVSFTPSVLTHK